MLKEIVLASSNPGKLNELNELLAPLAIRLRSQKEFGIAPIPETEATFVGNALLKARHASAETGLPAIADDSGLEVDALKGKPGVYSARFAGEHAAAEENNRKLVRELSKTDGSFNASIARFRCVIVLVRAKCDADPLITEGVWEGQIVQNPRGVHGFGYDPHFFVPNEGCTAAQMPRNQKNQISHRGLAVQKLVAMLENVESAWWAQ